MANVLIVEDSPSQAAIISEIVKEAGHAPTICKDLTKGVLQILSTFQPDIVLVDLVLLGSDGKPVADGFQICREVKRISKNKVGVVVVSSKGDQMSAEWAIMQGADAFLQKPFAVDALLGVIDEVLEAIHGK